MSERPSSPFVSQLELPIGRDRRPDRNAHKGGRSFYFFDFDDNIMRLNTCISIYNDRTGEEQVLSTKHFARVHRQLGKPGPYQDFCIHPDDQTGSYRRFRDLPATELQGREQPFVEDLRAALEQGDLVWKGPSWEFFFHAVFNERPLALVTARGHHPDTMKAGIKVLSEAGFLAGEPNYLGIYTVSHPGVRAELGDPEKQRSIPELKREAILRSVATAMQRYGENPYHRFGMSDDDPANVALAVTAMQELKVRHPKNAFFVINTHGEPPITTEIFAHSTNSAPMPHVEQLRLFGG